MTRLDEPIGPADRMSSALLTTKAHEDDRRCVNCPFPEGPCGMEWRALRAQHPGLHRLHTAPSDPT